MSEANNGERTGSGLHTVATVLVIIILACVAAWAVPNTLRYLDSHIRWTDSSGSGYVEQSPAEKDMAPASIDPVPHAAPPPEQSADIAVMDESAQGAQEQIHWIPGEHWQEAIGPGVEPCPTGSFYERPDGSRVRCNGQVPTGRECRNDPVTGEHVCRQKRPRH